MGTPSEERWVSVGHSADESARVAGAAAARAALTGDRAQLLMVFASADYDLPELLAAVNHIAGDVPVIGCSTAGEIGAVEGQVGGVVVVGIGGPGFDVRTAYATGLDHDPRGAGAAVASALQPLADRAHHVVVMLIDALAGDQQDMIRGVYGVFGAGVPLIGGGAGDNMRMVSTHQICGERLLRNAVVAAVIGSDSPFGIGIRHGWRARSDALEVTASTGGVVHTLDNRPALEVYLDLIDAPDGIEDDPVKFTDFALVHPLVLSRRGDDCVRHVIAADPSTGSLICGGAMPRGATIRTTDGDVASTLQSADEACADAIAGLGGLPPLGLLVFDCVGRRVLIGDDGTVTERDAMRARAGDAVIGGFYTYGEIARTKGVEGFHNQTIVTLALS
jgi:hypothetical protein